MVETIGGDVRTRGNRLLTKLHGLEGLTNSAGNLVIGVTMRWRLGKHRWFEDSWW